MGRDNATRPIESVETTFEVLDGLQELGEAGVTELANHLDLPKSTVHNHLATLEQSEYVVKDGDMYRAGLRFLGLGERTRQQMELYRIGRPEVEKLAEQTGELVNLAVEEHGRGVYLTRIQGEQAVQLDTYAGKRVHLHSTALGKAILAHKPRDEVERIIEEHGLPASTGKTVTDRDALLEQLTEIKNRGAAFDDEERLPGLRCVAAPIRTNDQVVGAVSVSGPTTRIKSNHFREELPELVIDAANVIAINLTYS